MNMLRKFINKISVLFLAIFMMIGNIVEAPIRVMADEQSGPAVVLEGVIDPSDVGYVDGSNGKVAVMTSMEETVLTYSVSPLKWAGGAADGLRVYIQLPSLYYDANNKTYRQASPNEAPGPMGIQGQVSNSNDWKVVGDSVSRGGVLVLEKIGSLAIGNSPAFKLKLKPYTDGSDGVYGSIPEGTQLEVNGYANYSAFNGDESLSWETPNKLDNNSIVKIIASNLKWETKMEPVLLEGETTSRVPIWDRYQYVDYDYIINNTSDNQGSIIEGYGVTFDIDTNKPNGIIPFDINRWSYVNGAAVANENIFNNEGLFIGVPNKGGILIYDITDWDGESELTNPIPYSYSGDGSIQFSQTTTVLTAPKEEGVPVPGETTRKYRVSLPLSRQGFPDPPTDFKIKAITNVLFGGGQNWSKTITTGREIVHPQFNVTFNHESQQDTVVYGYDTYYRIFDLQSYADAPIFHPSLDYLVDPDFSMNKIVFTLPTDRDSSGNLIYQFANVFAENLISYTRVNPTAQKEEIIVLTQGELSYELDEGQGIQKLSYHFGAEDKIKDQLLHVFFAEKYGRSAIIPGEIYIYGQPYRIGEMTGNATLNYLEKIASNDEYGANTTYTDVAHTGIGPNAATFEVIFPKEAIPEISLGINGVSTQNKEHVYVGTGTYDQEIILDYMFGVDADAVATTSMFTAHLNDVSNIAIHDATLILKKELFEQAKNIRVQYTDLQNNVHILDLSTYDIDNLTDDVTVVLGDNVQHVQILTDAFMSANVNNFVTIKGRLNKGTVTTHTIAADFQTYQEKPYDSTKTAVANGNIQIMLPQELNPSVLVEGVFGPYKTTTTPTQVSYESVFDVNYKLNTQGVPSPEATYTIDVLQPTKTGYLEVQSILLTEHLLQGAQVKAVVLTGIKGKSQEIVLNGTIPFVLSRNQIDIEKLGEITKIQIKLEDVHVADLQDVVTVTYKAQLEMGSTQTTSATFKGNQRPPYPTEKTATAQNVVSVVDTRTTVLVEGVNQVDGAQGSNYDTTVPVTRVTGPWGSDRKYDPTLDQGYKSLGGFTATMTRPTTEYTNNDQQLTITTQLPAMHFDMYYLKLRPELQPYVTAVKIYRQEGNQEKLWQTISGTEWLANTQEGSWRINTALTTNSGAELFSTHSISAETYETPYFKNAWHNEVRPLTPVSKVEVILDFSRASEDEYQKNMLKPQLPGTNNDVIEYMGRFYKTSTKIETTTTTTTDIFGKVEAKKQTRTHNATVRSLVGFSYAQTDTGAHDTTRLKNKSVLMGTIGEYKASIWNVETYGDGSTYHNGHGPDVYIPVATEWDEWIWGHNSKRNTGFFHDQLIYEFTYPANPNNDKIFNYDPQYFVVENSTTRKYLTEIRIYNEKNQSLVIPYDAVKDIPETVKINYVYNKALGFEVIDNELYVSLGTSTFSAGTDETGNPIQIENKVYPKRFEAQFEHIQGYGERTAEVVGAGQDTLGANLNEVDIRVGGYVNGNKTLTGTTKLYRLPDDSKKLEQVHTSAANLQGITPKLGGRVSMDFDSLKVYDYGKDGITPNTTTVAFDVENTNETDVKEFTMILTPDVAFRTQKIRIPAAVFTGGDWSVESVFVKDTKNNSIDIRDYFVQSGDFWEVDIVQLFKDGVLTSDELTASLDTPLIQRFISDIRVKFVPQNSEVRLFGQFTKNDRDDHTLPSRMIPGKYVYVDGVWADITKPTAGDSEVWDWQSKPSFVSPTTKSSNESVIKYSDFTASAELTPYQDIYVSAGGGNNGSKPVYRRNSTSAPALYNRVSRMQMSGKHLTYENTLTTANNLFYDSETKTQIASQNIAVGDTTKVLYEMNNIAAMPLGDNTPGSSPVFNPVAHFTVPQGLKISDIQVITANDVATIGTNLATLLAANTSIFKSGLTANDIKITDTTGQEIVNYINQKQINLLFNTVLFEKESVYFIVEYTAIDDYNPKGTQNKTVTWNVYGRPAFTHQYLSYNSNGVDATPYDVRGTTQQVNLDGDNRRTEDLARLYNTAYRFANPNQLRIVSTFDQENISGESMTLTVKNIVNELVHNDTRAELYFKLDRGNLGAFELTEFPTPMYPDGFIGSHPGNIPLVYFKDSVGNWILATDFDATVHDMKTINELKIDYGVIPGTFNNAAWKAPDFTIKGKGHWRASANTTAAKTKKDYVIYSEAKLDLTHYNSESVEVVDGFYTYTHTDNKTVYKAMPLIDFNVQSFATQAEAEAKYNSAALGKTTYVPGDDIYYKITAQNIKNDQGTATNNSYGKAALLNPIILDKIPEYLTTDLDKYITGSTFDITAALAAGDIKFKVYQINGAEEIATDIVPTLVQVDYVTGNDIGGAQVFQGDLQNNGSGLLSSAHPVDITKNPAKTINFTVIRYEFEKLERGARLEILYKSQARTENLPFATYKDGRPVYAPLLGWYGNANPVASNMNVTSMDMASLLHDVGFSGNRGHEMEQVEFLTNATAWLPGGTTTRKQAVDTPAATYTTYYDDSANKNKVHQGTLQERDNNNLYTAQSGSTIDDVFAFVNNGRVNDGKVVVNQTNTNQNERILWAQDGLQLSRAWLYGASEMVPDIQRGTHGVDNANFYEHDKSLNNVGIQRYGYTPYNYDNYTYAVQLHEEFTIKLHGVNLGDRAIENGLTYTEILPIGITPYGNDGNLLGIQAYDGNGQPIPTDQVEIILVQTPDSDAGYRAPQQLQEAGTYKADSYRSEIPYVLQVHVKNPVASAFSNNTANGDNKLKYQRVDVRVRVYEELAPNADGLSYWHDELTIQPFSDEAYYEIYDARYGAFNWGVNGSNTYRYPNDGMKDGLEVNTTLYTSYYGTQLSFEPYGMYIRGLNAQGTAKTVHEKKVLVTGDQLSMRKPTLRAWIMPQKATTSAYKSEIHAFVVDNYETFGLKAIVENQQLEVEGAYNRTNSGYNIYSNEYFNDDIWVNAPQTIGGARGSWFEPTLTMVLPYGIAPVLTDGTVVRYRQAADLSQLQHLDFTATINKITHNTSTVERTVTDLFAVSVTILETEQGQQFVLSFTPKTKDGKTVDIAYGESLEITPKVKVIDSSVTDAMYDAVEIYANTTRPVFNPIVSGAYTTGSTPTQTARDLATPYPYVKAANGRTINENDRERLDTTSIWNGNSTQQGKLTITERLIQATTQSLDKKYMAIPDGKHDKVNVIGKTQLKTKKPSIYNETKTLNAENAAENEITLVNPAGKFWYLTEVKNDLVPNENKFIENLSTGDVQHARFLITYYITEFAEVTGETRIKLGDDVLTKAEYEALGYEVIRVDQPDVKEQRHRVQFLVTTPAGGDFGAKGYLKNGTSFKFLFEAHLTSGYDENLIDVEETWSAAELHVDSYISLITDDLSLTPSEQNPEDFILQRPKWVNYHKNTADEILKYDIDGDGTQQTVYAHDGATIEIVKPRAEVRKNTVRPRLEYSNGLTGDNYFNALDTIEYLVPYAKITGSGLKEFVIEDILPTYEAAAEETSIHTTKLPITTKLSYLHTGKWELPVAFLEQVRLDLHKESIADITQADIDAIFKVFVEASDEPAIDGYEKENWYPLNPSGTSLYTNEHIIIPAEHQEKIRKVRIIVRALQGDRYLVPTGLRLDVDANSDTVELKEEVIELDPENRSVRQYPETVTDHAIIFGLQAQSDATATLFIYNNVQIWANYVGENIALLNQSETRSYLTPARPVVNIKYKTKYFKGIETTENDPNKYGWTDDTIINPGALPHLKFVAEVINADKSMWYPDEDVSYAEDLLSDPFVTFQLPKVMQSLDGKLQYVDASTITDNHPLSDAYRNRYSAPMYDAVGQWTWKLIKKDETSRSEIEYKDAYTGSWPGSDRSVVSIWFKGNLEPGDKIVVEFISEVNAYAPKLANDLKTVAQVSNNTGLLFPLNSRKIKELDFEHRLGYELDYNDFNRNKATTDRLVFNEKTLFSYATFDNFSKRKIVYSDIDKAGTIAPKATRVKEGGYYTFETTVDNPNAIENAPYQYPILYDVLPHDGDTIILDETKPRFTNFTGLLQTNPAEMMLRIEGNENRVYQNNEYTVYVGPFKRSGSNITAVDLPPASLVATQKFYDDLGVPGTAATVRDNYFVTLADFNRYASGREKEIKAILVMFNNRNYALPGQSKVKFTYKFKALINAPTLLERDVTLSDEEMLTDDTYFRPYTTWNSFVALRRGAGFNPTESNLAGAYVTEQKSKTYLGNYVWLDRNVNGKQDDGTMMTDGNGRQLLQPSDVNGNGTVDDFGINGVKVSLRTESGYPLGYVINEGNVLEDELKPIREVDGGWYVVNEHTGEIVLDETFLKPIATTTPITTMTETDFYGNQGYYVFSNIPVGKYRVVYEFPTAYDQYGLTTNRVFGGTAKVTTYAAGVTPLIPGTTTTFPDNLIPTERLTAVTDVVDLKASADAAMTDEKLMDFDLGIAHVVAVKGTIFQEIFDDARDQLNGRKDANEIGLAGYKVTLHHMDGTIVQDINGQPFTTFSDEQGNYQFNVTPIQYGNEDTVESRQYYLSVVKEDDINREWMVSPINHNINPFEASLDNDGFRPKGIKTTYAQTNTLDMNLSRIYDVTNPMTPTKYNEANFKHTVDIGFYQRSFAATIGNRVWDDLNQNGIQDFNEPGIAGQELYLEQYICRQPAAANRCENWELVPGFDVWYRQKYPNASVYPYPAVSNTDGYYYFKKVPTATTIDRSDNGEQYLAAYKVYIKAPIKEYNITATNQGIEANADEFDNDFFLNGRMDVTDFIILAGIDSDGKYDFGDPIDDITIDLGLHKHQRGQVSGKIFIDNEVENGLFDLEESSKRPEDAFILRLEVKDATGKWVQTYKDTQGVMVEQTLANPRNHTPIEIEVSPENGTDFKYAFENLLIVNPTRTAAGKLEAYQYRVVVGQYRDYDPNKPMIHGVPLWYEISQQHVKDYLGVDLSDRDSDFKEIGRGRFIQVATEEFVLGTKVAEASDDISRIPTFDPVFVEDIDLGLIPLAKERTIGSYLWYDTPAYEDPTWNATTKTGALANGLRDLGETAVVGREVFLYRLQDGSTTNLIPVYEADNQTQKKAVTDAAGKYEFTVPLADFNPYNSIPADKWRENPYYNKPYQYVVSFVREADETLVPIAIHDDPLTDNGRAQDSDFYQLTDTKRIPNQPTKYTIVDANLPKSTATNALVKVRDHVLTSRYAKMSELDSRGFVNYNKQGAIKDATSVYENNQTYDDLTIDGGLYKHQVIVNIGDTLFHDINGNGVQDETEPVLVKDPDNTKDTLQDIAVSLWIRNKHPQAGTGNQKLWLPATDTTGRHQFTATELATLNSHYQFAVTVADLDKNSPYYLQVHEYRILVENVPANYVLTSRGQTTNAGRFKNQEGYNANDIKDIEFVHAFSDALSETTTLVEYGTGKKITSLESVGTYRQADGTFSDFGLDAGFTIHHTTTTIAGTVWHDKNHNNLQDEDELGIIQHDGLPDEQVTVTLWRKNGPIWEIVADTTGKSTMTVGADGRYYFIVEPTAYQEGNPRFLEAYEYRVTTNRQGYWAWSDYQITDTNGQPQPTRDSDVKPANEVEWFNTRPSLEQTLQGVTDKFVISSVRPTKYQGKDIIDVSSIRNDEHMGIGIQSFNNTVKLGGTVWADGMIDGVTTPAKIDGVMETNEDRLETTVTLWKFIPNDWELPTGTGHWLEVATTTSNAAGYYEFTVAPTSYDITQPDYLKPYQYKVTTWRQGQWQWAKHKIGNNQTIDSNIYAASDPISGWLPQVPDVAETLLGVTDTFNPYQDTQSMTNNLVQIETVTNDINMGIGIVKYPKTVIIGDTLFEDKNGNGIQDNDETNLSPEQLAGIKVSLWTRDVITHNWKKAPDMSSTPRTEWTTAELIATQGTYNFEVEIADFDQYSPTYLQAQEYRVLVEGVPANYLLTSSKTANNGRFDTMEQSQDLQDIVFKHQYSDVLSEPIMFIDSKDIDTTTKQITNFDSVYRYFQADGTFLDLGLDAGFALQRKTTKIGGTVWHDQAKADQAPDNIMNDGVLPTDDAGYGVIKHDHLPEKRVTVTLWRKTPTGTWQIVADESDDKKSGVTVGPDGRYEFEVTPTDYQELLPDGQPNPHFLEAYEYRVTAEREGNWLWATYQIGADKTVDSNIQNATDLGLAGITGTHIGVTDSFNSSRKRTEQYQGRDIVDIKAVKEIADIDMGIGIQTFGKSVKLGGYVWHDQNADGLMADDEPRLTEVITLWKFIPENWENPYPAGTGTWIVVDEQTSVAGYYEFNVAPTSYDATQPDYLKPYQYKVTATRGTEWSWTKLRALDAGQAAITIDNNIDYARNITGFTEFSDPYNKEILGVSDTFNPYSDANIMKNNHVQVDKLATDTNMGIGKKEYTTKIVIGGVVWEDTNLDGLKDENETTLAQPQRIILQGFVPTSWADPFGAGTWEDYIIDRYTETNGTYEFEVDPTDYDLTHTETYLKPYRYRIKLEREGWQEFAPVPTEPHNHLLSAFDNDVKAETSLGKHWAISPEFSIYNTDAAGLVEITTVRDDRNIGVGIRTHVHEAILGGTAWQDGAVNGTIIPDQINGIMETNEDRLGGIVVQLWRFKPDTWDYPMGSGVWEPVRDNQGNHLVQTTYPEQNTDGHVIPETGGKYQFIVAPTNYDPDAVDYLKPYRYLVTTNRAGWQIFVPTEQGVDVTKDNNVADNSSLGAHIGQSQEFVIAEQAAADDQNIDITTIHDDTNMGIGIQNYPNKVVIGGIVWHDADFDGIRFDGTDAIEGSAEARYIDKPVTLWRFEPNNWQDPDGAGQWQQVQDLNGIVTTTTNAEGYYEFTVAPTNYDPTQPDYLKPYRYLVTTSREGWQAFAPVEQGTDATKDNNIVDDPNFGAHIGATQEFNIFERDAADEKRVNITTVHDDTTKGIGIKTERNTVSIGGRFWHDENMDGLQDITEKSIPGRTVTLWRYNRAENSWQAMTTENLEGMAVPVTTITNAQGEYRFEVEITNYETNHPDYLIPYQYLVTTERLDNERWTYYKQGEDITRDNNFVLTKDATLKQNAGLTASQREHVSVSDIFTIATVIEESGQLDIASVHDDLTQDGGLITYKHEAIIGDKVWHDLNKNGLQDTNELGIHNVMVMLQKFNSKQNKWIAVTDLDGHAEMVTDTNGQYHFRVPVIDQTMGTEQTFNRIDYRVLLVLPEGMEATEKQAEPEALNSDHIAQDGQVLHSRATMFADVDAETGLVDILTIVDDENIDFGLRLIPVTTETVDTGDKADIRLPLLLTTCFTVLFAFTLYKKKTEAETDTEESA